MRSSCAHAVLFIRCVSVQLPRLQPFHVFRRIALDTSFWSALLHALFAPMYRSCPCFSCARAGVGPLVLGKTRLGDCLIQCRACACISPHISLRSTTPINPVLKQDRRGIGKKKSGRSAYVPCCFYRSSSPFAAVTVEEASVALQLSSAALPVADARKDKSKVAKERDDKLKVQSTPVLHHGCTLNVIELTAAAQSRTILASGARLHHVYLTSQHVRRYFSLIMQHENKP